MDKPIAMPLKDYVIRELSVKLSKSEDVIDKVIKHQFSSAKEALSISSNDIVEISGWGKIKFNRKKAIKHYEKLLSKKEIFSNKLENAITEKEKNSYITKLNNTIAEIEELKPKIENEFI